MKVVLISDKKNLTSVFQDHSEIEREFGFKTLIGDCYFNFVNENLHFKAANWVGFLGNNTINPYHDRGSQEDGTNFYSNYFTERTISWEFTNVFTKTEEALASPNNLLNALLMEKNDIIRVECYASKKYYQDFFVTPNTDTEIGVIELKGAYGDQIYWNFDEKIFKYFFNYDEEKFYVTKTLPKNLLYKQSYPFQVKKFNNGESDLLIKIGGSKTTGTWSKIKIYNSIDGDEFTFNNTFLDDYITFDTEKKSVTNSAGIDRSSGFVGDFLKMKNGINVLNFIVNGSTSYDTAQVGLPLNFSFYVEYVGRAVGVE